jgi:predicted metalloprotease with PDZ domain
MGANTLRAAEREGRRVVVFAGSGHLLYNLGLNRRAFEKSRQPFKTVICVTVPPAQKSVTVARSLGDYIFGLPEETKPAFPQIGLSFKSFDGLANLVLESKPIDGAASRADFEKGDVILSIDGVAYTDINEARIYLAKFRCGEEFKVRLLRQGVVKEVTVKFDQCPAGPEPAPSEKK